MYISVCSRYSFLRFLYYTHDYCFPTTTSIYIWKSSRLLQWLLLHSEYLSTTIIVVNDRHRFYYPPNQKSSYLWIWLSPILFSVNSNFQSSSSAHWRVSQVVGCRSGGKVRWTRHAFPSILINRRIHSLYSVVQHKHRIFKGEREESLVAPQSPIEAVRSVFFSP